MRNIQKEIDNERGYARLTGGLPNPGYFSDRGLFGTVYFKGIQPGIVTVDYLDTSLVLANDSHGTNILKDPPSVSYLITPEKVSQADNQLQTALFSDQVLGAKTQSDQLIFYSDSPVLGAKTSQAPTSPPSFLTRCLEFLSRLNDLILRFWARLFHILPD